MSPCTEEKCDAASNPGSRRPKIAATEPPRVRAMLGAAGEQLGIDEGQLSRIRKSLNPLSRFDFGALSALKHAREWQPKERR